LDTWLAPERLVPGRLVVRGAWWRGDGELLGGSGWQVPVQAGPGDPGLGDDLGDGVAGVAQVRGVGKLVRIDQDGPADPPAFRGRDGAGVRGSFQGVGASVNVLSTAAPTSTPGPETSMPAAWSTAAPSPQAPMALHCRKTSCSRIVCLMSPVTEVPPATSKASNSRERAVAAVRFTIVALAPAPRTPPIGAMTRTVTPSLAMAFSRSGAARSTCVC